MYVALLKRVAFNDWPVIDGQVLLVPTIGWYCVGDAPVSNCGPQRYTPLPISLVPPRSKAKSKNTW